MQAINLLISEDPQLIFVIGMDWDTVAAGIAVKHEALCRYLTPGARLFVGAAGTTPMIDKAGCRHNENDENTREGYTDTYDAMEFGREFLDKFVQLRFKVPRPSNEDLRRLLLALSRPQAAGTHRSTSQARPALWRARVVSWLRALVSQSGKLAENRKVAESSKGKTQQSGEPVSQTTELKELIEFGTNADSDTIRAVALRLMPAFDNNPRRLKQFLGLYRLRIYIAKVTGMFAIPKGEAADRALSLPQLGKFTALELGWPDLLKEAQLNTELFGRLEQEAHRQEAAGFYWRRRGLAEVIRAGLDGDEAARQQWSLAGLDFRRLLRVSASVGPFDAKIGSPPDAPEVATRPQHDATAEEWVERGRAAAENNEKLRCYTEAIKLRPDYAPAFLSRGNVLAELGAIDRALADYDEAIRLKPHDASALYNRGMAYSDKGDRDRALMDYDEAIRLKPDDADAFINRGIARANNDDVVGALADFDQAVQLRPDDVDGYYNRSIERHRKGDLEGALSDDNQAARLKLGNTDAV
jgi:tetratricopeptide (TPR) repeat protein